MKNLLLVGSQNWRKCGIMSSRPRNTHMTKIYDKCNKINEKAGARKNEEEVYDMLTELQLIIYQYRNEIWRKWVNNGIHEEMREKR